jgi:hypothetical protein
MRLAQRAQCLGDLRPPFEGAVDGHDRLGRLAYGERQPVVGLGKQRRVRDGGLRLVHGPARADVGRTAPVLGRDQPEGLVADGRQHGLFGFDRRRVERGWSGEPEGVARGRQGESQCGQPGHPEGRETGAQRHLAGLVRDAGDDVRAVQAFHDIDGLIEPHVAGQPRVAPGDEGGRRVSDTHADNHKASECRRFVPETRCESGGPAACGFA